MLLIGSQALAHITQTSIVSPDMDFIATHQEHFDWVSNKNPEIALPLKNGKGHYARKGDLYYEFEIAYTGTSARDLYDRVKMDSATTITRDGHHVPSLNLLYALKLSHRYLKNSPHFLKTMRHIRHMRTLGAVFPEAYRDWFKKREQETYNYKHPNLNQKKEGFFDVNRGVTYVYDHDSIHLAMAVDTKPAYSCFKPLNSEVRVSKAMFFALNKDVQLNSVLEESYVLALERSQVPFKGQVSPITSFKKALEKCCTSIASGWWREFAWEHYEEVLALYDPGYVDRFWAAVDSGIVQLASKEGY